MNDQNTTIPVIPNKSSTIPSVMSTGYACDLAERAEKLLIDLDLHKPYAKNLLSEASSFNIEILPTFLGGQYEPAIQMMHDVLGGRVMDNKMHPLQINAIVRMRAAFTTINDLDKENPDRKWKDRKKLKQDNLCKKTKALDSFNMNDNDIKAVLNAKVMPPTIMQTFRNLAHITSVGITTGERNLQGIRSAKENIAFHQNTSSPVLAPKVKGRHPVTLQCFMK